MHERAKGSSKLRDRMDASYAVKAMGETDIQLTPTKMKDALEPEPLTLLKVPIEIVGDDREMMTSLALTRTQDRPPSQDLSYEEKLQVVIDQFNWH